MLNFFKNILELYRFSTRKVDWLSRTEAASIIQDFLDGKSASDYEWDYFCSALIPYGDPLVAWAANECQQALDKYPALGHGYCSADGMKHLAEVRVRLLSETAKPIDSM